MKAKPKAKAKTTRKRPSRKTKTKTKTCTRKKASIPAPPPQGSKNPAPIFMRPLIKLSPEMQDAFLSAIANGARHVTALKMLDLTWRSVSIYMTSDPTFRGRYENAVEMREQLMTILREEEADRRAIEGWNEPVFQNGYQVGVVRRFSDKLMELRLKAANPSKYVERHEYSGVAGGPIQMMVGGPERPKTIAEWERQVADSDKQKR